MDLPHQPAPSEVTPSQAGEAAASQIVQQRLDERKKSYEDSLDIRDPSVKQPEPKPEEQPVPVKPGQPQTIAGATPNKGLTPDLLSRARDWNISEQEAAEYTPAALSRLLDRFDATQPQDQFEPELQYGQPNQQGYAFDPNTGQPLQPQFDPYTGRPLQQQLPELPRLDPEAFHPDLVAAWDAQQQYMLQQQQIIAEQNARFDQIQQQLQQQEQARVAAQNRDDFNKLEGLFAKDEEYRDVFGEGPAGRLVGTREHAARAEVAQTMDDLAQGYARRGQRVPDLETLYARAKNAVHGARAPRADAATLERIRARNGQFIAKPTATTRTNKSTNATEAAVSAVGDLLRQQGRM